MLDFLFYKKRSEVSRILTGRMNTHYAAGLDPGERRSPRCTYCEVVWLIEYDRGRPCFDEATPVVSKDISPTGLSLIHTSLLQEEHVIVGLRQQEGMVFIRCRRGHSTALGCGYFQIGLAPLEIVHAPREVASDLRSRMSRQPDSLEAAAAD